MIAGAAVIVFALGPRCVFARLPVKVPVSRIGRWPLAITWSAQVVTRSQHLEHCRYDIPSRTGN